MRNKLVNIRKRKLGLQQNELADKLGIAQSSLSKIESGVLTPSMKVVRRMADVYGEPLSKILDAIA